MKLRAFLVIVPFALGLSAACGPSVNDVCSQYAQVWCQQQYTCKTGADLQAIQTKYGADVATCAKAYGNELHCANTTISPCPAGYGYDTGRGQQCTTEYQALTCADIEANTSLNDCSLSYICH